MKLSVFLCRLFLACLICSSSTSVAQIVGEDVKVARDDLFLSQVRVEVLLRFRPVNFHGDNAAVTEFANAASEDKIVYGGGTIIDKRWVLTSAHLFDKKVESYEVEGEKVEFELTPRNVRVLAGEKDCTAQVERSQVSHAVLHRSYDEKDPNTIKNDIAVLRLENELDLGNDKLEKLPLASFQPTHDMPMKCVISGWGRTDWGAGSDRLRWAQVWVVDPERTRFEYNDMTGLITVGKEWLTNNKRASASVGDSGGGLQCVDSGGDFQLFGVVQGGSTEANLAAGVKLGEPGIPTLVVSVFHHRDWINRQIGMRLPHANKGTTLFLNSDGNEISLISPSRNNNKNNGKKRRFENAGYGEYFERSDMIVAVLVGGVLALIKLLI